MLKCVLRDLKHPAQTAIYTKKRTVPYDNYSWHLRTVPEVPPLAFHRHLRTVPYVLNIKTEAAEAASAFSFCEVGTREPSLSAKQRTVPECRIRYRMSLKVSRAVRICS